MAVSKCFGSDLRDYLFDESTRYSRSLFLPKTTLTEAKLPFAFVADGPTLLRSLHQGLSGRGQSLSAFDLRGLEVGTAARANLFERGRALRVVFARQHGSRLDDGRRLGSHSRAKQPKGGGSRGGPELEGLLLKIHTACSIVVDILSDAAVRAWPQGRY